MDGPEEVRDTAKVAKTRPKPRFRGNPDESGDKVFSRSRTGTLLLPAPINTPAEQQRRASSEVQSQI